MRAVLSAGLILILCACQSLPPATVGDAKTEAAEITALLNAQDEAWNRGDIDSFMSGYWKSPALRFASGGTVTRGWNETNARYKSRYSSRALMGRLISSDYEIEMLGPDTAVAHGKWELERDGDKPWGLYTLILRKTGDGWKIISDTTTSAE